MFKSNATEELKNLQEKYNKLYSKSYCDDGEDVFK